MTNGDWRGRPLQISWSGLKRYEECKQKHLLVISGKSDVSDGRVFLPGTIADRIMRAWLESPDPRPGEMVQMVPEVFRRYAYDDPEHKIRWRSANDPELVQNFVRASLQKLEPLLLEHVLPHGYQPELRFRVQIVVPYLDGSPTVIELVGGIDIVVMRGPKGNFILWDLKMSKSADYARQVLGQLILYAIAFGHLVEDLTEPREIGFIMPALPKPVVTYTVSEEQRAAMMSRILRMAHSIWQRHWEPKPENTGCNDCQVKRSCPKFDVTPQRAANGRLMVSLEQVATRRRLLTQNTVEPR